MKIIVIAAGLSDPSTTRMLADRLLGEVSEQLDSQAASNLAEVIELKDLAVDIARATTSNVSSPELDVAVAKTADADALIVVTPVFSGSYSGLFKSFFDILDSGAIIGAPVIIGATGGSARHALVLEHALRPLLSYLRAVVMPTAVYAAPDDWAGVSDTVDGGLPRRVARAASEITAYLASATMPPRTTEPVSFERTLQRLTNR